jgi:uncharacterized membrane protein YeaQ/YmgE (transglycosylase-associated protein family)
MVDSLLTWMVLGFLIALFIRFAYASPTKNSFSSSMFLGTMGAASGEAMSKLVSMGTSSYASPLVYMFAGAVVLIIWSLNSNVAS